MTPIGGLQRNCATASKGQQVPSAPIALGLSQSSGLEELAGAAALCINTVADATNAVSKRPGITTWADFPAPAVASEIQGICVFGQYLVYVTADRKIHAWLASGLVQELSSAVATTQLDGDQRPVLIATKTRLVIAGGGALQYWDGLSALSARLPGNPPTCTHVLAANQRLVINIRGNTGQVGWSEAGELTGQTDWTHGNFLELEDSPDPCVALYANNGELAGFGTKTTEMLVADPVAGYLNIRTLQIGTLSPYSFIEDDTDFAFLDHKKRFQVCDGRSFNPASSPAITKTVRDLATVSDCWGFLLPQGAFNLMVWVFPTEQVSFVYNTEGKSWSEWRGRSAVGWTAAPFSSYCYFPQEDLHLVGTAAGLIKQLRFDAKTDDGNALHAEMVSGFQDHASKKLKICQAVRLIFRVDPGTTPRAALSWRDDQGAFEEPIYVDVDETNVVEIRTLGTYRMRQWKLVLDDEVSMSLIKAEEDFEVLDL